MWSASACPSRNDLARVGRTAQGWDALPGEVEPPSRQVRRFVVDFLGGPLEGAVEDSALSPVVEANAGEISEVAVRPLPDGEGHRVTFRLVPDGERVSDMRLFLRLDGERVTETWSYVWDPAATR